MSQIFQKPPNNYQYIAGLANAVDYENIPVTVGPGPSAETTLQDLIVKSVTLIRDGQQLRVNAFGEIVGSNNTKNFYFNINGTRVSSVALGAASTGIFLSEITITRLNSTTLFITHIYLRPLPLTAAAATTVLSSRHSLVINTDVELTLLFSCDITGTDSIRMDYCSVNIL